VTGTLLVPARFNGPAASGNGGYVSGALAQQLFARLAEPLGGTDGRAVTVTLRQPPPLDSTMQVNPADDGVELTFGGAVVARAALAERDVDPVETVSWQEAEAARATYPGYTFHPFPTCFACGTERPDGLRIHPGEVAPASGSRTRVAAPWVPEGTIDVAITWSALDCIGGWAGDLTERLMVLGQMTASIDALPVPGEQHVVTGEHRGTEGRKTFTASTLHDADGRIVGRAEHVWIAVDPARFNG
jgi:hypothetical protein